MAISTKIFKEKVDSLIHGLWEDQADLRATMVDPLEIRIIDEKVELLQKLREEFLDDRLEDVDDDTDEEENTDDDDKPARRRFTKKKG